MEPYSVEFLVDKFYDEYNQDSQKLAVPKPTVMIQNKKTCIVNFKNICDRINRTNDHVKNYFDEELANTSSINSNGGLVINGIFKEHKIMTILEGYIKKFLMCSQCKNLDTQLIKENRLNFMKCNTCFSKKVV